MNIELQTIAPIDEELGVKLVSFNETDNMPILKKYMFMCVVSKYETVESTNEQLYGGPNILR